MRPFYQCSKFNRFVLCPLHNSLFSIYHDIF
nr:MAG TPA: hypothetical protein [Caudoviricetes sp.]